MSVQHFFHVVGNGQRNGVQGYIHERCYRSIGAALNYAVRVGRPVWIVESTLEYLQVWGNGQIGNFDALRWNSGAGLVADRMPPLPLVR